MNVSKMLNSLRLRWPQPSSHDPGRDARRSAIILSVMWLLGFVATVIGILASSGP
jgi:hypothetical protein